MYVEYVYNNHKDKFFMGPSIHPYRKDCVKMIDKYHKMGVKIVKWLL